MVTDSEQVGETMHPSFEIVRTAIDNNEVDQLTVEELTTIKNLFSTGTGTYKVISGNITALKPPVKVLGIHKKLDKAFIDYVASCQKMVESIKAEEGTVDVDMFNESEKEQDAATDAISFSIQRITELIMKR